MNAQQFIDSIERHQEEKIDLLRKKNTDYAADEDPFRNFRMAEEIGLNVEDGILLRILDKIARITNLHKRGFAAVSSETVDNAIMDASNYLDILYVYREGTRKVGPSKTTLNYTTTPPYDHEPGH